MTSAHFKDTYTNSSDKELWGLYQRLKEYTPEAQEAIIALIDERGGYRFIAEGNWGEKQKKEMGQIKKVVYSLTRKGVSAEEIKTKLRFDKDLVLEKHIDRLIHIASENISKEIKNKKIDLRTIFDALLGAGIGAIVSGVVIYVLIIGSNTFTTFYFTLAVIICYAIVKFLTKKDRYNIAVILGTTAGVLGASKILSELMIWFEVTY